MLVRIVSSFTPLMAVRVYREYPGQRLITQVYGSVQYAGNNVHASQFLMMRGNCTPPRALYCSDPHAHARRWNAGMGDDIMGDIHGQAGKLKALLKQLGYRERMGAWRHPERSARFAGDLIDRGPGQLETLDVVRRMVDAGSTDAIMGNLEFNGIAYATQDPERPGEHLRTRGPGNHARHRAFLDEVVVDSAVHREWVQWFMTLPLWIETDQLRRVHACRHPASMAAIADRLGPGNTLTPELVPAASRKDSVAVVAVEASCKGLEIALPAPVSFTDKQGIARHRTRVRWWDSAIARYDQAKPVFFGHCWFSGRPGVISATACCVDYSAALPGEPRVAYRFDGEDALCSDKVVAVRA